MSAAAASPIPVIDLAPFHKGGVAGKRAVAAQVDAACRDFGFLQVTRHGVPGPVCDALANSPGSAAAKANRSPTWPPATSMTRKHWPSPSGTARPSPPGTRNVSITPPPAHDHDVIVVLAAPKS